jgi:hypothetical protein
MQPEPATDAPLSERLQPIGQSRAFHRRLFDWMVEAFALSGCGYYPSETAVLVAREIVARRRSARDRLD